MKSQSLLKLQELAAFSIQGRVQEPSLLLSGHGGVSVPLAHGAFPGLVGLLKRVKETFNSHESTHAPCVGISSGASVNRVRGNWAWSLAYSLDLKKRAARKH
jgi:hypothetical protein